MKAWHQARAATPAVSVSSAAQRVARSPVRPLLKVLSVICAATGIGIAAAAPSNGTTIAASILDGDMRMLLPYPKHRHLCGTAWCLRPAHAAHRASSDRVRG